VKVSSSVVLILSLQRSLQSEKEKGLSSNQEMVKLLFQLNDCSSIWFVSHVLHFGILREERQRRQAA
jgi:hypothetical protein